MHNVCIILPQARVPVLAPLSINRCMIASLVATMMEKLKVILHVGDSAVVNYGDLILRGVLPE